MLILYRRHTGSCQKALQEKGIAPSKHRDWTKCDCPIWITGTHNNRSVARKSLGTNDWSRAVLIAKNVREDIDADNPIGLSIAALKDEFLEDRKLRGRSNSTLSQYSWMLRDFASWCGGAGIRYTHQLSRDIAHRYIAHLSRQGAAPATVKTKHSVVSYLCKYGVRRGLMSANPFTAVERIEVATTIPDPFPEDKVEDLFVAASKLRLSAAHGGPNLHSNSALVAVLKLMYETGMRKSDAIAFDPGLLERGTVEWVYSSKQVKTGKDLVAFVTDRLKMEIEGCAWESKGFPFLPDGATPIQVGKALYRTMQRLGKKIGVEDCRPHRLRDAFAVRLLQKGMPIYHVSKLLGHSSVVTTERYYAKWTPGRIGELERQFGSVRTN